MALSLPVYMDYQSTTPVDPRVAEVVASEMKTCFGNPHSRSHSFGWESEEKVEIARKKVATLINADARDVIFTSGATESNNLAIQGLAAFYGDKRNHVITICTEHKCVINACRSLEQKGFDVTFLPVNKNGLVDLQQLEEAITDKTLLVSVMAVHNEIGVIQPIKEIGKITRARGVFFHTDAAQGFGKIPLDVEAMNIDLMSISGHKIYATKGIGALYVRRKPRVRLLPILHGGGQERGLRSGTVPTFLASGLGVAAEIALKEMDTERKRLQGIFDKFYHGLVESLPEVTLNGDKVHRYPGNVNVSFGFVEGESMVMAIDKIAVSSGSACTSASLEPSYVIKALGVSEDIAHTSIRFGFGRFTTDEEVDFTIKLVQEKLEGLRQLSPLWEMHSEGVDVSKVSWQSPSLS